MNSTIRTACRALLPAVLLLQGPMAAAQERPPATVETADVRNELVAPALWVPGTVISREDSLIAAEVAGVLTAVADVGARVKRGEVLAQVNDRELQLGLKSDEARIAGIEARMVYLERQVGRLTALARSNTTAEAELDQVVAERDMLKQELEGALVTRDRTRYDMERTRILAPFDGVVVERIRSMGEYLDRGQPVVRLVNTSDLEVRVQAPITTAMNVHEGDMVTVLGASRNTATRVRSVIPVGDEVSRMLQLRLELADANWVIGEPVRVAIEQGRPEQAVTVPRDALVLREGETFVYTVTKDNTARRVNVVAGNGTGDRVSISGDLKPGDRVIIRGAERLQDGQSVTISKIAST